MKDLLERLQDDFEVQLQKCLRKILRKIYTNRGCMMVRYYLLNTY